MMHRLTLCLVIALLSVAAPRPAAAAATDIFDSVNAVEVNNNDPNAGGNVTLTLQGIRAGGTTPSTTTYVFSGASSPSNLDMANQCQRLAVLVMSKPGKFQFAISPSSSSAHGCKLILRTP